MEGLQLRVKDLEIERGEVLVRMGKGGDDRITLLADAVRPDLVRHLARMKAQHDHDLKNGAGWVAMPTALSRKLPKAGQEFPWQYVFPATRVHTDAATGQRRRHHLHETAVQRAVADAVRRAGLTKRATTHSLRHSFATHLLRDGYDIRTVQQLLGHKSVETTMIYLHVLDDGVRAVRSPLDRLTTPMEPALCLGCRRRLE